MLLSEVMYSTYTRADWAKREQPASDISDPTDSDVTMDDTQTAVKDIADPNASKRKKFNAELKFRMMKSKEQNPFVPKEQYDDAQISQGYGQGRQ